MNDNVYDKDTVEKEIPIGTYKLSLQGVGDFWVENDRAQKLGEVLFGIIQRLADENRLVMLSVLRLIVVTHEFEEVVLDWGQQLGRHEKVTKNEFGEAGGKIFVWGNEYPEIYAVIVLEASLVASLVLEPQEMEALGDEELVKAKLLGKRLFVHELAHIDTEIIKINRAKSLSMSETWPKLQLDLADNIFSEFYSEAVSRSFVGDCDLIDKTSVSVLIGSLEDAIEKFRRTAMEYQGNIGDLFPLAVELISLPVTQTGRCLGLAVASEDKNSEVEALLEEIGKVSPKWAIITRSVLIYIKERTDIFQADIFQALGNIVGDYFHAIGVFPKHTPGENLWIDVRF